MPLGHIGFLTPMNQQAKKRVAVLVVVIDTDHEREIRLLVYGRDKEYTVWNTRDTLRYLKASLSIYPK